VKREIIPLDVGGALAVIVAPPYVGLSVNRGFRPAGAGGTARGENFSGDRLVAARADYGWLTKGSFRSGVGVSIKIRSCFRRRLDPTPGSSLGGGFFGIVATGAG
jgi:hypothetical protein